MIKSTSTFIFWILLALPFKGFAILFSAPDVDSGDLQKYALEKNQPTYSEWLREKVLSQPAVAHDQILHFVSATLQENSRPTASEWQEIRTVLELNSEDREVLTRLAQKIHSEQPKNSWAETEACRYLLLEEALAEKTADPALVKICETHAKNFVLPINLAEDDVLFIDGIPFSKNHLPKRWIPGTYHWHWVSNRLQDFESAGPLSALELHPDPRTPWVTGTADRAELHHPDFTVLSSAQIYFGRDQIQSGLPKSPGFKEWASENHKALWIGLGILAAGFAAYELRDKTLVVTQP